jgi:hypothetical protein
MSFERVCAGFQQVLLFDPSHEVPDLGEEHHDHDHMDMDLGRTA